MPDFLSKDFSMYVKEETKMPYLSSKDYSITLNMPTISWKPTIEPYSKLVYAREHYEPKDIIRNGPATIVFWKDGTKTIVKLTEGGSDDPYAAFCMALAKKIFKTNGSVKRIVSKTRLEPKEK